MASPDTQQELADLILEGVRRRPRQAFGSYFERRDSSCALGAAYDGMYYVPSNARESRLMQLEKFFDCLDSVRPCPEGEGCKKRLPLASLIVHLNDDHRWTRERIADWLRGS